MKLLVHRVCEFLRFEAEVASGSAQTCKECPLTTDTPYGPGTLGCVLRAQELIELVRSDPTSEKQS